MTPPTLDIGDRPTATVTFRNTAKALTSPTTVVFITRSPSGVEASYTTPHASITNPSVGVFVFTFPAPLNAAGKWYVRAKGTAGHEAAAEQMFQVRASNFTTP